METYAYVIFEVQDLERYLKTPSICDETKFKIKIFLNCYYQICENWVKVFELYEELKNKTEFTDLYRNERDKVNKFFHKRNQGMGISFKDDYF